MNKLNNIIFPHIYPSLDLHGFDRQTAEVAINDFIKDNQIMGNEIVTIVHGVGSGIIRETTQNTLKRNPLIEDYKIDNFNNGMTIVIIKSKIN